MKKLSLLIVIIAFAFTNCKPSGKALKEAIEKDNEVMLFNSHALTFVMVNAIQELAGKVKELESALEKERRAKG